MAIEAAVGEPGGLHHLRHADRIEPLVAKQLPHIPHENIITEPLGRNTAPCIALAALFIQRLDPEAVMVVLPADHVMQDEAEFRRILNLAIWVAYESGKLITVGIQPTRPETGYGYIQVIDEEDGKNPYFSRGVFRLVAPELMASSKALEQR